VELDGRERFVELGFGDGKVWRRDGRMRDEESEKVEWAKSFLQWVLSFIYNAYNLICTICAPTAIITTIPTSNPSIYQFRHQSGSCCCFAKSVLTFSITVLLLSLANLVAVVSGWFFPCKLNKERIIFPPFPTFELNKIFDIFSLISLLPLHVPLLY